MKHLPLIVVGLLLMASCTGGQTEQNAEADSTQTEQPARPVDVREVFGEIGDGTSMHVLELITDSLDTLDIELSAARMMGGLVVGDRADVIYQQTPDGRVASLAINLSALQHVWSRPNSQGGTSAIELDQGGTAISYDQTGVDYDHWALVGGRLVLHAPARAAVESSAASDTFDILALTADTLVLGNHAAEIIYTRDN